MFVTVGIEVVGGIHPQYRHFLFEVCYLRMQRNVCLQQLPPDVNIFNTKNSRKFAKLSFSIVN